MSARCLAWSTVTDKTRNLRRLDRETHGGLGHAACAGIPEWAGWAALQWPHRKLEHAAAALATVAQRSLARCMKEESDDPWRNVPEGGDIELNKGR